MLNILIVDDEAPVRYGLEHEVDWRRYGMAVAGTAESAAEARERIQALPELDVVFTDMMMPKEDGLSLLRWVRQNHPGLSVVILTYHSDFKYIQDALRYGASDYIIKTELEQPDIARTLERVAKKRRDSVVVGGMRYADALAYSLGSPLPASLSGERIDIDGGQALYMLSREVAPEDFPTIEGGCAPGEVALLVRQSASSSATNLYCAADIFFTKQLFYLYTPGVTLYEFRAETLATRPEEASQRLFDRIQKPLLSLIWIDDQDAFQQILDEIEACMLSPVYVFELFSDMLLKCRQVLRESVAFLDDMPLSGLTYWYDWREWFTAVCQRIRSARKADQQQNNTYAALQDTLRYLSDHFAEDVSLSDAARMTHLSEGHFAKVFHATTGSTYVNYVLKLRMEYAKRLILCTQRSVASIAERCGFRDTFYFTRVFKKYYGTPPGRFRKQSADA